MRKLIKVTWQENAALIRRSEGRALILTIPGGKVDLYQAPWAGEIIAEMRGPAASPGIIHIFDNAPVDD